MRRSPECRIGEQWLNVLNHGGRGKGGKTWRMKKKGTLELESSRSSGASRDSPPLPPLGLVETKLAPEVDPGASQAIQSEEADYFSPFQASSFSPSVALTVTEWVSPASSQK